MSSTNLNRELMLRALKALDRHLHKPVTLLAGGGGAMILAHDFPLATSDIDAIPRGMEFHEIDGIVKQVARELGISPDWLNPWFASFTHTLPRDFNTRTIEVFVGANLRVQALGATDLLIMKCFAHRQKDVGHAKALIKRGADVDRVREHIESLDEKGLPKTGKALDFLDDILDSL